MHALVKNFRSVVEGNIEIAPIALICGKNHAGKTSMAKAIAAAATGMAVPYAKVTKKDCKILLRQGTHAGSVTLATDEGTTEISWPDAEVSAIGMPPSASTIAAGLTDLFSMKEDAALAYMINLLKASPTEQDLERAFAELDIEANVSKKVWDFIQAQGWDAAHKQSVTTGQKLKGAWQQITGVNYGDKKALEWVPEGWEDSFASLPLDSFDERIATTQEELEKAIGQQAVSSAERERLAKLAEQRAELEEKVKAQETVVNDIKMGLDAVELQIKNTPNPDAKNNYSCPHCEKPVHISAVSGSQYLLTKADSATVNEKDLKAARSTYAKLCGEQQNWQGKLQVAKNELSQLIYKSDEASAAALTVAKMGEPAGEGGEQDEIKAKRDLISQLLARKAMVLKFSEAKKAVTQIATNQKIVDTLDETGLRKKKLSESIGAFVSSWIEPLCADFGIPPITMSVDLKVNMGATAYAMLSESEQYRVNVVFQLAIARLEKASLVIIDRADILDNPSRSKLMQMISKAGIPAVICMTVSNPSQALDLSSIGAGITYWVENGNVSPLNSQKKAAA